MSDYPFASDGYLAMSEQLQRVLETYQRIAFDVDLSPLTNSVALIEDIVNASTNPDMFSRLSDSIKPLLTTLEATRLDLANLSVPQVVSLSAETVEALQRLEPYVPEEKQEEFQEIIQPEPTQKGNRMTFDRVLALVSLLLTLLTLVTYFLPDKDAQITHANELTMIENQRETNELLAERNQMLQNISDALQAVRDDCDAVPELAGAVDELLQGAADGADIAPDGPNDKAQSEDTEREEPQKDQQ